MRAIRYHEAGDPSVLQVEEVDRPEPGPDEVQVELRAASINPIDAKLRAAGHPRRPKTTGSDLAGVVTGVGSGVESYDTGDRVFATGLHTERFAGGSFAEYVAVPTDLLAPLPDRVPFDEGAAAALVGVTAWRAFVDHARLDPGASALVHGGSGGVGHVAVGLADAMGVTTAATARPEHHDDVRVFGADAVVDYDHEDLAAAVDAAVGPVDAAAQDGDVVVIAGEELAIPDVAAARGKELDLHLMSMSNLATQEGMPDVGAILARLGRLLAEDRLTVRIDRTLPLAEAREAHRAVVEDSVVGKTVVVP